MRKFPDIAFIQVFYLFRDGKISDQGIKYIGDVLKNIVLLDTLSISFAQ